MHAPTGQTPARTIEVDEQRLLADVPWTRLDRLPDAGHFLSIDQPERLSDLPQGRCDGAGA